MRAILNQRPKNVLDGQCQREKVLGGKCQQKGADSECQKKSELTGWKEVQWAERAKTYKQKMTVTEKT